nr:DUF3862 domain-containing protein [Sporolactobacillus sp. STSJ-5]
MLIAGFLSACSDGGSTSSNISKDLSSTSTSTGASHSQKSSDRSSITKTEFNKIKDGMTYKEVATIVGSNGEVMSEAGEKGDPAHTVIYSWNGDKGWGANANVTFQNNKVINKAQFGVDSGSSAKITMKKFDQVKNGMTYDQIKSIIGGDGAKDSESGTEGSADYTVIYSFQGSNLGSNATFMFQGGKLINKAQAGLK